nr:MAG TPA: hypothetical protein [Caudoviricetes sp.]DAY11075.1 MAG TPA: hypothetical protein [Caudoviricetes sp.]
MFLHRFTEVYDIFAPFLPLVFSKNFIKALDFLGVP